MLDWSDRHCRYFWRQLTGRALCYTEMVTTGALIHGDRSYHLQHHPLEQPLALQLGGSDPAQLARCARWAEQYGYVEINLNAGCPSDRVQSGRFGACLMADPALVAECMAAMIEAVSIPVTIKHRIGIDDLDSYEALCHFVDTVRASGCGTFIIHARKAWLQGLSPRQNREIPPLDYATVHRIKQDFPGLEIVINGGIQTLEQCRQHLAGVDGVMLGRAAYQSPWLLSEVDRALFGDASRVSSRTEAVVGMIPYIEEQLAGGARLNHITRHLLGLFNGAPGARAFRRHLSEHGHRPGAGSEVLLAALDRIRAAECDLPSQRKAC